MADFIADPALLAQQQAQQIPLVIPIEQQQQIQLIQQQQQQLGVPPPVIPPVPKPIIPVQVHQTTRLVTA